MTFERAIAVGASLAAILSFGAAYHANFEKSGTAKAVGAAVVQFMTSQNQYQQNRYAEVEAEQAGGLTPEQKRGRDRLGHEREWIDNMGEAFGLEPDDKSDD